MANDRTTTRTIRIPITIDEEVINLAEKMNIESINEAYNELIKVAVRAFNYSKEIEEKPDKKEEVRSEFEDFLKNSRTAKSANELFAGLGEETLEIFLIACHMELQTREKKRKLEEANIAGMRAQKNYEVKQFWDHRV